MFSEDESLILKLAFWTVALPFVIVWKIGKLIFFLISDRRLDRQVQKADAERLQRSNETETHVTSLRSEQLEKIDSQLAALVPKTPANKLRATFHQGSIKVPRIIVRWDWTHRQFLSEITSDIRTKYVVCVQTDLTETDRAVVSKHQLDEIELDSEPYYTADEIDQLRKYMEISKQEFPHEAPAVYGPEMKRQRSITVGDFTHGVLHHESESAHEANLYAAKVKTKLLPAIKELIQQYSESHMSETVEI
jgi:hypothetical protein